MKIKTRVKFSDKGHLLVDVPYKHGNVTWALNFHRNHFDWILFNKPDKYSPTRVTLDHHSILNGKKLRSQMISKAAASHQYGVLDKIKATIKG